MYCSLPTPCLLACLLSPAWSQVLTEFGSPSTDKESPEVLENRYSKPFPYYFLKFDPKESPLFRCTSSPSILLPTSARCDRYPDCPSGEVRQEDFFTIWSLQLYTVRMSWAATSGSRLIGLGTHLPWGQRIPGTPQLGNHGPLQLWERLSPGHRNHLAISGTVEIHLFPLLGLVMAT